MFFVKKFVVRKHVRSELSRASLLLHSTARQPPLRMLAQWMLRWGRHSHRPSVRGGWFWPTLYGNEFARRQCPSQQIIFVIPHAREGDISCSATAVRIRPYGDVVHICANFFFYQSCVRGGRRPGVFHMRLAGGREFHI